MKMITRCPTCGTAFRVYPEQLDARAGQVRCGQCAAVFDAHAGLVSEPDSLAPADEGAAPARADAYARAEPALAAATSLPLEAEMSFIQTDIETDAATEFDFGPPPRPQRARALRGAGAGLLVVALAAQLAYAYRGELAALTPATQPALAAMCRALGCTIPLPHRAQLISIESSELAAERGAPGLFTLAAILRNRAEFTQAHPGLELTLTNARDQPIARRVLRPQDYVADRAAREAGLAANSEYGLKVYLDTGDAGATGYRLYAFDE